MNNICMFSSQTFKAFKLCIDCEVQTNTSSSFCHGVFMKFEYLWLKSWGIPVLLQSSSSLIPVGHRAPYPGGRVPSVLPAPEGGQAGLRSHALEMVSFATQMLVPAFALPAVEPVSSPLWALASSPWSEHITGAGWVTLRRLPH